MSANNCLLGLALAALLTAKTAALLPLDEIAYTSLLKNHAGHVVVVDFWATWCEPCREEMPLLVDLRKKFGFTLITVSADEPEQQANALRFLIASRVEFPAWIKQPKNDEAFINAVDSKWSGALPGLFLYDRSGKLRHSFIGETDTKELESALRKLL